MNRARISKNDACERMSKTLGMDVFLGHASFISENKIKVGGNVLEFARCVIATGGTAAVPPIKGLESVK